MKLFRLSLLWILLIVGVPFGMPQLISYASSIGEPAASWSTARRDRTYISPSPDAYEPAIIQVFGAKTWGWRGRFGIHTWIAIKGEGASNFVRYEVIGWRAYSGNPSLTIRQGNPDNYWFGNQPEILAELRGKEAQNLIPRLRAAINNYPHKNDYVLWPGPNSNSFTAHIGRQFPELKLDLPPTAIGKDYLVGGDFVGKPTSGKGFQFSISGYGGFAISPVEGVELHLLGLTTGFDFNDKVLKIPGFGRISLN